MAIQFSSNVAVDTDVLFVDTINDRVGIGTTSPSYDLHVEGSTIIRNGDLRIDANPSTYPTTRIYFTKNNSTSPAMGEITMNDNPGFQGMRLISRLSNSPYTESSIQMPTSSSYDFNIKVLGSNRMTIKNGNVGIGTTNPDKSLHVYGTLKVEDTSTSTSSYAAIEMEGRGVMGSQYTYLRTDSDGDFSIANGTSSSSTLRPTSLGALTSISNNANASVFEASGTTGLSGDAVTMLFKANNSSTYGSYNETGIEVDRVDGWSFSSTKRGKMRLQTGGNDHITMTTSVSEFSTNTGTTFNQVCNFEGVSSGFISGVTATFAGKVGIALGTSPIRATLDVGGGIRMADDTSTATQYNTGTLRYRTSGNNSYVDMCMQTGASTYEWVNIVQNSW